MAEPGESGQATLRCPGCGFENATTSLYCQDCGGKLTVAPPSYLKANAETPTPTDAPASAPPRPAKPPRILSAKRDHPLLRTVGLVLRLALLAALLLGVVQFFRAPAILPPAEPALDQTVLAEVRSRFAQTAQTGSSVTAPWPQVNRYLAAALAPGAPGGGLTAAFVRAGVLHQPGGFTVVIERRLLGLPLFLTTHYRVVVRGSGLDLQRTGGAIGRVPLPAWAAPLGDWLGGDLGAALKFELDILRNARTVRISPVNAQFDFGRPRP